MPSVSLLLGGLGFFRLDRSGVAVVLTVLEPVIDVRVVFIDWTLPEAMVAVLPPVYGRPEESVTEMPGEVGKTTLMNLDLTAD